MDADDPRDPRDLLTVRQVAEQKLVTPDAVRKAIKRGALTAQVESGAKLVQTDAAAAWQPTTDAKERGQLGGRPKGVKI
jgi:hypothetical protein